MSLKINRLTIEPAADGGWNCYGHGRYTDGVLKGTTGRAFQDYDNDQSALVKKFPKAEVLECGSQPFRMGNESLAELSGMSVFPPSDFDPGFAGERWGEDDW